MKKPNSLLQSLDARSRDIFKNIVETYLATGDPVGSRTLSKGLIQLSAASIRNVMADLTELGLLDAPHVSAGRMPTHAGLRLFVDGFLEMGEPGKEDRFEIDARLRAASRDFDTVLKEASSILSGLAAGQGLSPRRPRMFPFVMLNSFPCRPVRPCAFWSLKTEMSRIALSNFPRDCHTPRLLRRGTIWRPD